MVVPSENFPEVRSKQVVPDLYFPAAQLRPLIPTGTLLSESVSPSEENLPGGQGTHSFARLLLC